jgi:hypothetical protein
MIRGAFITIRGRRRPFIAANIAFPTLRRRLDVPMLVDTGADRTVLSPVVAGRLGINLATLARGQPGSGVGGQMQTRMIDAVVSLDAHPIRLTLAILEAQPGQPPPPIPSPLGRDILSRFALFLEERTDRVLLLEPHEADALVFP